jgi:hypothetical protein
VLREEPPAHVPVDRNALAIAELRETVELLQNKISKLEQLVSSSFIY